MEGQQTTTNRILDNDEDNEEVLSNRSETASSASTTRVSNVSASRRCQARLKALWCRVTLNPLEVLSDTTMDFNNNRIQRLAVLVVAYVLAQLLAPVLADLLLHLLSPEERPPPIVSDLLRVVIGLVIVIVLDSSLYHPRIAERPLPRRDEVRDMEVNFGDQPSQVDSSISSQPPRPDRRVYQGLNLLGNAAANDDAAHNANALFAFAIPGSISIVISYCLGLSIGEFSHWVYLLMIMMFTFLIMLLVFLRPVYLTVVGRFQGNQEDNGGGRGGGDGNNDEHEANHGEENDGGDNSRDNSQCNSSGGITF